jgi:hypothetical protein
VCVVLQQGGDISVATGVAGSASRACARCLSGGNVNAYVVERAELSAAGDDPGGSNINFCIARAWRFRVSAHCSSAGELASN